MRSSRIGLGIAFLLAMTIAAQARPDTRRMSCTKAHATVVRNGAIVMSTGRFTYDRFVASRRYCEVAERLEAAYVPTFDRDKCFVGYRCVPTMGDDYLYRPYR